MRIAVLVHLTLLVLLASPLSSAVLAGGDGSPHGDQGAPSRDDAVLLYLQAGVFDPVQDPVPGPSWMRRAPSDPYYVVQFDGPIQRAWREAASSAGAELLDYLPDYAYFARVPRDAVDDLEALDHVRYVGPAHLTYRVDPDLWSAPDLVTELEIVTWGASSALATAGAMLELGGDVLYVDLSHVTVRARLSTVLLAAADPSLGISWVEPKYWPEPLLDNDARSSNARQGVDGPYQANDQSAWSYNAATDAFEGWTGENVTVTVADSGLDDSHPAFAGRIVQYYDYGNDGQQDNHGHGTHCSGIVLGDGSWRAIDTIGQDGKYAGLAPEAGLVVQEVFNNPYGVSTYNRDATRSGATISSNSWGYGAFGAYYTICQSYDDHTRDADTWKAGDQPLLFTFSAGNDGTYGLNSITPPATAKNVLTVGATGNDKWGVSSNTVTSFSSRGPTDDGRLKPDVVMPGHQVASARSMDPNACSGWSRPSDGARSYIFASGTSMAAPGAAGAAAVVTQYMIEEEGMTAPSPAVVKASLINGARPLPGYEYPGNVQGWGAVDLTATIFEDGDYRIYRYDQEVELDTAEGEDVDTTWFMVEDDEDLKITLVWTDPGGVSSSTKHLINDLNLEVTAPDGSVYYGNAFSGGVSEANSSLGADWRNNVEGILVKSPQRGIWQVSVKAYNIPGGPQDFALVVSGDVEEGYLDLAPTRLSVSPEGLEEFNVVTASCRLGNLGNRVVDLFEYTVEHEDPSGTVTVLDEGNRTDLGGESHVWQHWDFTGARGVHKIRVVLDPDGLIPESDETNNVIETEYFFKGYGVGAGIAEGGLYADPGQLVQFNVTVRNKGNVPDEFRVTITDPPEGWTAVLVADTFELDANERTPVTVSVVPPPDALAAEEATIEFTVTSLGNETKTRTVTLTTTVNQVFGLELRAPISQVRLLPGETGSFELVIENPGNGRDVYELLLPTGLDAGWWPAIPESFVELGHRSEGEASVLLTAPQPSPAGTQVRFDMLVRSKLSGMEARVTLSGSVRQFYDNGYSVERVSFEGEVNETLQVEVRVDNRGNGPVGYTFDVGAPSSEWYAYFSPPELELDGYSHSITELTFTIPESAINRTYDLAIAVLPASGEVFERNLSVSVLQFHSLGLEVSSEAPTVTQGEAFDVVLSLVNAGNGVETVSILVPELPGIWYYELEEAEVDVDPFDSLDVSITFQTNKESPGGDYELGFLVRYGSSPRREATARASATLLTRPDLRFLHGEMNASLPNPVEGDLVNLFIWVENTGETEAREIYVQFYYDGTELGQPYFINSLAPGEREGLSESWLTNASGIHELSAVVDVTGDVDETDEGNNRVALQVEVEELTMETSPGFGAVALLAALSAAAVGGRVLRRRRV